MIPDKLYINLKIIGKIQKNGRLKKSCDGVIALDKQWYLQSIFRALYSDSRKQTLYELDKIINDVRPIVDSFKVLATSEKYLEEYRMLVEALTEAEEGIQNLKFTYISDDNTAAHIDIILFKVANLIKEAAGDYAVLKEKNEAVYEKRNTARLERQEGGSDLGDKDKRKKGS